MSTELVEKSQQEQLQDRRRETMRPHYTVDEAEHSYRIRVDLPGVTKDAAAITLEKQTLTVEATRMPLMREGWRLLHREIPSADYKLRLQLNVRVDEAKIRASSDNGVLTIELPMAEEAKPRTITIQ